jgi:periplasmic protein TonB
MEANKILTADILDLVFEDRNKEYGAYALRKTYNKRIRNALIITASIALLALLGSLLANTLNKGPKVKISDELTIENIEQKEEKKEEPPPPPPPIQEPPKVEMTQFTPPKIVKDEEVKKEEIPPEQEKLEDTKISTQTQEGIKTDELMPTDLDQKQEVIVKKEEDDENYVWTKVEKEAEFPGGDKAWMKFLTNNLNGQVPLDHEAPAGKYTVWIQFIVDKEGSVSDLKALTNNGYGMEEEAMRVLRKVPKWQPALQNGRNVKAYRKQPITFVVTEGE